MAIQTLPTTLSEFEQFAALPENAGHRLEFIGGEVHDVVSNSYASEIAAALLAEIRQHVKTHGLGRVTGADGRYLVSGEPYLPDAAFISKTRQPAVSHAAYNPNAPDLAVEVVSPTDSEKHLRRKLANYLAAGTRVWVVYPDTKEVEDYAPGQPAHIVPVDGTLDGGGVLPGFRLAVKEIFPD
jgi:Uma2 family endonuclease